MGSKWDSAQIDRQDGRVVIVTGANSGIGYEAARVLAERGARVVLACRSRQRGMEALAGLQRELPSADVELRLLDLASLASIDAFATEFARDYPRLDLLIANAGVMMPPRRATTADGFELQLGTNHLGHFALVGRLLPLLLASPGARVVVVSSLAHRVGKLDFDDPQWERRRYDRGLSYGQSKLANLLFMHELQRRLAGAGADTCALAAHPGWTATNLQRDTALFRAMNPLFAMKGPQGALPTLRAATDPDARGGEYYGPDGLFEAWGHPRRVGCTKAARDPDAAARLWELSEQLTGVRYDALAAEAVATADSSGPASAAAPR